MRSPRSVTFAPIFMPSRSLNAAIDFFALVMTGFWPRDRDELVDRHVQRLRVDDRFADAHVDHDLLEPRNLVNVVVAEVILQLFADFGPVLFF